MNYKKIIFNPFFQASLLLLGTLFIYKPIPLLASDTSIYFPISYKLLATYFILLFIVSFTIVLTIYKYIPYTAKNALCAFFITTAILSYYSSLINPIEGPIIAWDIPMGSYNKYNLFIWIATIFTIIALSSLIFFFPKSKKYLNFFIIVINLTLIIQTIILSTNYKEIEVVETKEKLLNEKLAKLSNIYSFSKDKNVLLIMLDMLQSGTVNQTLKIHPQLKQKFNGFTYYPNTLSVGAYTRVSVPVIAGGDKYQIRKLIKIDNDKKVIYKKIQTAYEEYIKMSEKYNYQYTMVYPQYGNEENINYINLLKKKYNHTQILDINEFSMYDKTHKKINIKNEETLLVAHRILRFSVFNMLPRTLKKIAWEKIPYIVQMKTDKNESYILDHFNKLMQLSQLQDMIDFSNNKNPNKAFKFIQNTITHPMYTINKKCQFGLDKYDGNSTHLQTAYCALYKLGEFFDKLKELKVYDNTKIIIVSDHGSGDIMKESPLKPRSHITLLVKDFYDTKNFIKSDIFLSNVDIYGIVLSGVSDNKQTNLDKIKKPEKNRTLYYTKYKPSYEIDFKNLNVKSILKIKEQYKVKDNVFNEKNWIKTK